MPPPRSPIVPRVRRTSPQKSSTITLSPGAANSLSQGISLSNGSPHKSFIQNSPFKQPSETSQNGESCLSQNTPISNGLNSNDVLSLGDSAANEMSEVIPVIMNGNGGGINTSQSGEMNITENGEISQNGEMNTKTGEISQNGEIDTKIQNSEMSEVIPILNKTVNIDNSVDDMSEIIPPIQSTNSTVS